MFKLPRVKQNDLEDVEESEVRLCACTYRENKEEYFLRRRDQFFTVYHSKFIESHFLQRSFSAHLLRILREQVTHKSANALRKRLNADLRRIRMEARKYRVGQTINVCDTCFNKKVLIDYLRKLYAGGPNPFLQINRIWDETEQEVEAASVQTAPLHVVPSTSQHIPIPSQQTSLATLRRQLQAEELERKNISDRVHETSQDVLRLQTELQSINEECRELYDNIETSKYEKEEKKRLLAEAKESLSEVIDEAAILIDVTARLKSEATQASEILRSHLDRLATLRTTHAVRTQTTAASEALQSAESLSNNLNTWIENWTEILKNFTN